MKEDYVSLMLVSQRESFEGAVDARLRSLRSTGTLRHRLRARAAWEGAPRS